MMLVLMFIGCNKKSDKQIAQEASADYIKQQMKNPESFKILFIETDLDTIPPYLSEEVYNAYEQYLKAEEETNDFIPDFFSRASLVRKKELLENYISKAKGLQAVVKDSRNEIPDVQYLTCIKYNAANAIGGTLSSYSIVVASKEKPDSILGSYDLENENFVVRFKSLSKEYHGKDRFKSNKYGKIDTVGFSLFEKFIIDAMQ